MKTKINRRLLTAAICIMMGVTVSAQAQSDSLDRNDGSPCPSTWTKYDNLTETYSMVRSNNMNHVVYIQEKVNGTIRHTFIVKRNDLSEVAFSTYFVTPPFTSVEISDMRLYEDTCYFCGKHIINLRDSVFRGPRTRGFVGRFVTREVIGNSDSVSYYIVDTTFQLTRLAISRANGFPLVISAIGEMYPSRRACIVELENSGTSEWGKRFDTIDIADKLVFSDIMTMRDSITLLAQYTCLNDDPPGSTYYDYSHQIFLLCRFHPRGCHATYSSGYCNMALHTMPVVYDYYYHRDKAPMRLFHINDQNNDFGVAFGVEEENGMHGGIRLFKFHNAWKYYTSLYYRVGVRPEIIEIGNQYRSDTLYVLSKSSSNPNGEIALPSMGIGPTPVVKLIALGYTFNSLTQKFAGNHIDISGHDASFKFHLFDQYIYNHSRPTCFHYYFAPSESFLERRASAQYMRWQFAQVEKFKWNKAVIEKLQTSSSIICEECN